MTWRSMLCNSGAATVSRSSFMYVANDPNGLGSFVDRRICANENHVTGRTTRQAQRRDALRRAADFSPFLREAMLARPEIGEAFAKRGATAGVDAGLALGDGDLELRLRRQRHGLALAVALGDLAGEMPLEEVTRRLSDFADRAIDQAIAEAIASACPTPSRKASR